MEFGKELGKKYKIKIDNGFFQNKLFICLSPINFASCEDLLLRKSIHIIILIIK